MFDHDLNRFILPRSYNFTLTSVYIERQKHFSYLLPARTTAWLTGTCPRNWPRIVTMPSLTWPSFLQSLPVHVAENICVFSGISIALSVHSLGYWKAKKLELNSYLIPCLLQKFNPIKYSYLSKSSLLALSIITGFIDLFFKAKPDHFEQYK